MRTENFRVVPRTNGFVVAAFLAIVPSFQAQDASSSETATQEENIREAVFRYMFEHNASGQKKMLECIACRLANTTMRLIRLTTL
jgi:hypothetical protein